MATLRMMPRPIFLLILNALYKGFQMRYHLSQKFFEKMVKIKETSFFFTRKMDFFERHCNCTYVLFKLSNSALSVSQASFWTFLEFELIPTSFFPRRNWGWLSTTPSSNKLPRIILKGRQSEKMKKLLDSTSLGRRN